MEFDKTGKQYVRKLQLNFIADFIYWFKFELFIKKIDSVYKGA